MANGTKPMYQPWNEEEFMADDIVQAMTPIQRWMYRTLVQKAFFCSTRPYLPNDNEQLWMLAGCENKEQWMKNKSLILKKFTSTSTGLLHKRVFSDYENWLQLVENKRYAAQCRWNADALQEGVSAMQVSKEVREVSKISKAQFPETKISEAWERITGQKAEDKKLFRKKLRELIRLHGEEAVLGTFETWAIMNQSLGFRRPVSQFIKNYSTGNQKMIGSSTNFKEINDLAVELSFLSSGDITFNRLELTGLGGLLQEFSREEILLSFKRFYSENEQDLKWAAKNFIEKAPQIIQVARLQKERSRAQEMEMDRQRQEIQSREAANTPVLEAQAAQDETLLADTLNTFKLGNEALE